MSDEPKIKRMNFEDGILEMDIVDAQNTMVIFAASMRKCLDGAENYVEMSIHDKERSCEYLLTLQRKWKPTPHELRKSAEQELSRARKLIAELVKMGEFYASPLNYNLESNVLGHERPRSDTSRAQWPNEGDTMVSGMVGGKLAREVLSNNKELIEKLTKG